MGEKRGMKALEAWCRKVTDGYRDVAVLNMSTSWRDGLAFCAIIHHFRPDLIDYDGLKKEDIQQNNDLAFSVAEKHLGIPSLLDAEDMVKYKIPDKLSILTYVSQFYQYFQGNSQHIGSPIKAAKRPLKSSGSSDSTPDSPPEKISTSTSRHPDVCQACQNRVYILERLIIDNKLYHRTCFKCCRCNSVLKPAAYVDGPTAGQYECTSCPDEEEAEKAALASMASARLAQLSSSTGPMKWKMPEISAKDYENKKFISSQITDARKAFLIQSNETESDGKENVLTAPRSDDTKNTDPALNSHSHLNNVSQYLFGANADDKPKVPLSPENKNSVLPRNCEESPSSFIQPKVSSEAEDRSVLQKTSSPKDLASGIVELNNSQISVILPDSSEKTTEISSELEVDGSGIVTSKINDHNETQSKSTESEYVSVLASPVFVDDELCVSRDVQKCVPTEAKQKEGGLALAKQEIARPVPSPRSHHRKSGIGAKMSDRKDVDKSSEDLFTTPQSSPDVRLNKKRLELNLTTAYAPAETSPAETSPTETKDAECARSLGSPTVMPVRQSHLSGEDGPLSPSKSGMVFRDMPVIQPQIGQNMLSPKKPKDVDASQKANVFNDAAPKRPPSITKSVDRIHRHHVELPNFAPKETVKKETVSKDESEDKPASPATKDNQLNICVAEKISTESKTTKHASKIDVEGTKISLSPESTKGPDLEKKSPPPRPQLPSVLLKSPDSHKPPSSVQQKTNDEVSYPDDLNPFKDDDETDSVQASDTRKSDAKKVEAKSLNPFEESDDEFEDALKPEDVVPTSSPLKKISYGIAERAEPPRTLVKIEAPKGLNPFDEDESENDEPETEKKSESEVVDRRPARPERPTPLPRMSMGTQSLGGSPAGSLGKTTGMKCAASFSASSSPAGSFSRATGRRCTSSNDSSPAISPPNSLGRASGEKFSSSRDSLHNISPTESISKGRKKRPAPKPPAARILFTPPRSRSSERENNRERRSSLKMSPRLRKKSPAPPPPPLTSVSINEMNDEISQKALKDLGNTTLKSMSMDAEKNGISPEKKDAEIIDPQFDDPNHDALNASDSLLMKQRATFGYWKKKKPAPPIPLPPKRQTLKLPIAEIDSELAIIEQKQLDLEQQGVELEKTIRERLNEEDETSTSEDDEENNLIFQLFELVNQKNILFRRQSELVYIKRQQRLEEEHAELEFKIRCLMGKPEGSKSQSEHEQEEELINRLIEVVKQRNEIIESMENDRIREAVEDKNIQEQLAIHQAGSSRSSLNSQGSSNSVDHVGKKEKSKKKNKKETKQEDQQRLKSKEREKEKIRDEDKDLDDVEVALNEKTKKQKKRRWF